MSDHQERPASEAPVQVIDREIYGMPVFVSLEVSDLTASSRWYHTSALCPARSALR